MTADHIGAGPWDWWLVAVLAVGVLVMVAGIVTRRGDER